MSRVWDYNQENAMKKCLIVINLMSGRAARIDRSKLLSRFGAAYDVTFKEIRNDSDEWSAQGFDLVIACGGDGTFNRALNLCSADAVPLIYYGFGTFNECAKAKGAKKGSREFLRLYEYASVNGRFFGYVAATGTFTPLGYIVPPSEKQKLGIFAYLARVLGEYRVCSVPATVTADGTTFTGNYTLVMAIDSVRCFGFRFNRLYRPDDGKIQLLLIKSPGKDSLLNRARIFFPFFRAFFIGFRREVTTKNVVFRSAKSLTISTRAPETYDIDGDRAELDTLVEISVTTPKNEVYIGDFDMLS